MTWASGAWSPDAWEASLWEGDSSSIVVYATGQQTVISISGVSVSGNANTASGAVFGNGVYGTHLFGVGSVLAGVSSTGAVGAVNIAASSLTEVSGVTGLFTIGGVSVAEGTGVSAVGVAARTDVGILSLVGDALSVVTGTAATFSTGNVTTAHIYRVDGVEASTDVGGVAITGEALTLLTGQESTGIVGVLSISGDGNVVITGVEAETFFNTVDVIVSYTFEASGFELVSSRNDVSVETTSFVFDPTLYAAKRTVFVEGREDRTVFIKDESRTVFVEAVAPVSSGTYADVKPRIVSVEAQNRVLYVGKAKR